jgi:hypothetical protein
MFLRNELITAIDAVNFADLINRGVSLKIVIFEDPNGDFEYPVFLATYQGVTCHFHYLHQGNENQLQQTITDVWNFLNQ